MIVSALHPRGHESCVGVSRQLPDTIPGERQTCAQHDLITSFLLRCGTSLRYLYLFELFYGHENQSNNMKRHYGLKVTDLIISFVRTPSCT